MSWTTRLMIFSKAWMTDRMPISPHAIRALLRVRPFQRLRVTKRDGSTYIVHSPDSAFLSLTALVIGIDLGEDGVPESCRIFSIAQISGIEPIDD